MPNQFFLNYGSPEEAWMTLDESRIFFIDKNCKEIYGEPIRYIQLKIKDVNVIICTYGIHRGLILFIPDDASNETKSAFDQAKNISFEIVSTEYNILTNNCVTAVAKVLHALDPRTTSPHVIWPWTLDSNIKKYGKYYPEHTVAGQFMTKYHQISKRECFSFLRTRHWEKSIIDSNQDIISHAYGKTGGTGERTKSTLLQLGWVIEDKQHMLRPTDKSPKDFKEGLESFNQDYENMLHVKQLYLSQASILSKNARIIFKDNPDYETALARINEQAQKNPKGASAKVLEILKTNKEADYKKHGASYSGKA